MGGCRSCYGAKSETSIALPPQELEEGLRSGPYLIVLVKARVGLDRMLNGVLEMGFVFPKLLYQHSSLVAGCNIWNISQVLGFLEESSLG